MGPALLEAQINQGGAFGKVVVPTGNITRALFADRIGHNNKVPVLLIARRRRFNAVANDIFEGFWRDHGAVKVAARRAHCQLIE